METAIGTLTAFAPNVRPTNNSIRSLEDELITKCMETRHHQAPTLGFAAHFMKPKEITHIETTVWTDPIDPGRVNLPNNAFMSENERQNWIANHDAHKQDYVNLQTFISVIKAALNHAIPEQFLPGKAIGQRTFGNMTIRKIFDC